MTTANPAATSFASGELTSLLDARTDLTKHYNGCRLLRNQVSLPWGPADRRPPTLLRGETKDSSKTSRLIAFQFSSDASQSYMMEWGEGYIRWFFQDAQVVVPPVTAAIANGDFTAGIGGWTNKSTGSGSISHDATNGRLNLVGTASSTAFAEQQIAITEQSSKHVLTFRVFGAPGDLVTVRIGTTAGASDVTLADDDSELELAVGTHSVEFTPGAASVFLQIGTGLAKTVQIDDVALLNSGGSAPIPFELATPYQEGELRRINKSGSGDKLWLFQGARRTHQLQRRGQYTWGLVEYDWAGGPWLPINGDSAKTIQPAAANGLGVLFTASGHAPFKVTDLGRLIWIEYATTPLWGVIVEYVSPTQVKVDIKQDGAGAGTIANWRLGLYHDGAGWPVDGALYEERLTPIGAAAQPNRFDLSGTDDFNDFDPGKAEADDAIAGTVAGDQVDALLWVYAGRDLLVGTAAAVYKIDSNGEASPIAPDDVRRRLQPVQGSEPLKPIRAGRALIYLQRHGRAMLELVYSLEADGHVAPNISILAHHLAERGLMDVVFQAVPWSMLWAYDKRGRLLGTTYQRDEDVVGWHAHPLGGGGQVESIAEMPGPNGDQVWMTVKRTVAGQVKRFVERMADPATLETPQEDDVYLDGGLSLDNSIDASLTPAATEGSGIVFTAGAAVFSAGDVGRIIKKRTMIENPKQQEPEWHTARAVIVGYTSPTEVTCDIQVPFLSTDTIDAKDWRLTVTTVGGLELWEGETLQVVGDGAVQSDKTVVGGEITLDAPAATVHAGKVYPSYLVPSRFEFGAEEGSIQGSRKRAAKVAIRVHRSAGFQYGRRGRPLDQHEFRTPEDAMDTAVPLFTGDVEVPFPGDYDRDPGLMIAQELPLPLRVLSLYPKMEAHAR